MGLVSMVKGLIRMQWVGSTLMIKIKQQQRIFGRIRFWFASVFLYHTIGDTVI
jgi:hypothetical protein